MISWHIITELRKYPYTYLSTTWASVFHSDFRDVSAVFESHLQQCLLSRNEKFNRLTHGLDVVNKDISIIITTEQLLN